MGEAAAAAVRLIEVVRTDVDMGAATPLAAIAAPTTPSDTDALGFALVVALTAIFVDRIDDAAGVADLWAETLIAVVSSAVLPVVALALAAMDGCENSRANTASVPILRVANTASINPPPQARPTL